MAAEIASVLDIFKCFICLEKVCEPHLCACCSKIVCFACIKRWLEEERSQCPHCRSKLTMAQLVNCRFVTEISTELEKLNAATVSQSDKDRNNKSFSEEDTQSEATQRFTTDQCTAHHLPMCYYCETCSVSVCSDCAMFSESHRGHQFVHLKDVYLRQRSRIVELQETISSRIERLRSVIRNVDSAVDSLVGEKNDMVDETLRFFDAMNVRLEARLRGKMTGLLTKKSEVYEDLELLEDCLNDSTRQLQTLAPSQLIACGIKIEQKLSKAAALPLSSTTTEEPKTQKLGFSSPLMPAFVEQPLTLHDFSSRLTKGEALGCDSNVVYSQPMKAFGTHWRLKVYPNGNGVARGSYLSVFLEMISETEHTLHINDTDTIDSDNDDVCESEDSCDEFDSIGSNDRSSNSATASNERQAKRCYRQRSQWEYRFELVNQCCSVSNSNLIRQCSSRFDTGECWGYNRFVRIDTLQANGYLKDDKLIFRFSVRPPSYYHLARFQNKQMIRLENQITAMEKQLSQKDTTANSNSNSNTIETTDSKEQISNDANATAPLMMDNNNNNNDISEPIVVTQTMPQRTETAVEQPNQLSEEERELLGFGRSSDLNSNDAERHTESVVDNSSSSADSLAMVSTSELPWYKISRVLEREFHRRGKHAETLLYYRPRINNDYCAIPESDMTAIAAVDMSTIDERTNSEKTTTPMLSCDNEMLVQLQRTLFTAEMTDEWSPTTESQFLRLQPFTGHNRSQPLTNNRHLLGSTIGKRSSSRVTRPKDDWSDEISELQHSSSSYNNSNHRHRFAEYLAQLMSMVNDNHLDDDGDHNEAATEESDHTDKLIIDSQPHRVDSDASVNVSGYGDDEFPFSFFPSTTAQPTAALQSLHSVTDTNNRQRVFDTYSHPFYDVHNDEDSGEFEWGTHDNERTADWSRKPQQWLFNDSKAFTALNGPMIGNSSTDSCSSGDIYSPSAAATNHRPWIPYRSATASFSTQPNLDVKWTQWWLYAHNTAYSDMHKTEDPITVHASEVDSIANGEFSGEHHS